MHKLQPLMADHGVIVFQTEKTRELIMSETAMAVTYEFTIAHRSGAVWPDRPVQTGVAAAKTSKGSPDDKCINKCHTAARKYFLLALFQIPTGDFDDADADGEVPANDTSRAPSSGDRRGRAGDPGDDAVAYMARFRTLMQACESEAELRALWKDHGGQRVVSGITQEQVHVLLEGLKEAIGRANASATFPQAAE